MMTVLYSTAAPTLQVTIGIPSVVAQLTLAAIIVLIVTMLGVAAHYKIPLESLALLFAAPPIALALSAIVKQEQQGVLTAGFTAIGVLAFSTIPRNVRTRAVQHSLIATITISIVLSAVSSEYSIPGRDFLPGFVEGRAFGLLGHPNMLGLFSGSAVILSLILPDPNRRRRRLLLVVGTTGLLACASQTSIIATLASFALYILWRLRRSTVGPIGSIAAILTLSGLSTIGFAQLDFFAKQDSGTDLTFTGRTEIWAYLLDQQVGFFGMSASDFIDATQAAYGVNSAHNTFLELWGRGGYLTVIAVAVFTLGLFRLAYRSGAPLLIVSMFVLVTMFFESAIFQAPYVFFAYALLSAGQASNRGQGGEEGSMGDPGAGDGAARPIAETQPTSANRK